MLSKIIISSYKVLIEISIWLILIGAFLGGMISKGIGAGFIALFVAFIFCVVFFGAFLTLVDIQQSVKAIENRQNPSA